MVHAFMPRLLKVTVLLSLAACQTTQKPLTATLKDQTAAPLAVLPMAYVVSGGFNTCGAMTEDEVKSIGWKLPFQVGIPWGDPGRTKASRVMLRLLEQQQQATQSEPRFVFTCFNGVSSSTIFYYSSKNRALRWTNWQNIQPIIDEVNLMAVDSTMTFVGHSYGGWLAMQLASATAASQVKDLVTIDPISPAKCNQAVVALGFSTEIFTTPDTNCTHFPPELNTTFVSPLVKRYNWFHFYQTIYPAVHSGPVLNDSSGNLPQSGLPGDTSLSISSLGQMAAVDQSTGRGVEILFPSPGKLGGAHKEIDDDTRVWQVIAARMGLALNPPAATESDADSTGAALTDGNSPSAVAPATTMSAAAPGPTDDGSGVGPAPVAAAFTQDLSPDELANFGPGAPANPAAPPPQ